MQLKKKSVTKNAKATKIAKKSDAFTLLRVFLRSFAPFAALGFSASGCATSHSPTTRPILVAPPVASSNSFAAPRGNFSTALPTGWKKVEKGGDYVVALVPDKSPGGDNDPVLSVQYPNLPPHIPGMLPLGGVADGYVNDLKKRFPDEKVDERSDAKLDGANARHVISSFQKDGKPFRELALLAVHGDHVYVITATCPAAAFDQSQSAFDQLTSNWKWKA